jgi:hypothetical protein
MNDADFDILARQSGGAFDAWMRSQALGHAIRWNARSTEDLIEIANRFHEYIKGEQK